jgi:hypothetical protein
MLGGGACHLDRRLQVRSNNHYSEDDFLIWTQSDSNRGAPSKYGEPRVGAKSCTLFCISKAQPRLSLGCLGCFLVCFLITANIAVRRDQLKWTHL